jgi:hypothetical protein
MNSSDKWREWVEAGLLSSEQVTAISAYERDQQDLSGQRTRTLSPFSSTVPEAIGYLGGLLALGGLIALVARLWEDVSVAGRIGMTGGAALVLGVAGALIIEDRATAFTRLRAVLWTLSVVATGITVGITVNEWVSSAKTQTVVLAVSAAVLIQAGLMWASPMWAGLGTTIRQRPLQLIAFLVAWPVVTGSAVAHLPGNLGQGAVRGVTVWLTGAVLVWLGLYRIAHLRLIWAVIGAIAALVGAALVASQYENLGLIFTLVTAVGILALAVIPGLVTGSSLQIALGVIAAVATWQIAPRTIGFYASEGGLATGLVTWAIGGLILVAGVRNLMRLPRVGEMLGAAVLVIGAAVIATQFTSAAILIGLMTAIGLLALGMFPGRVLASVAGSVGLLINVPWGISHFFPGEGRVPLLILITGLLILGLAVLLARRLTPQKPVSTP